MKKPSGEMKLLISALSVVIVVLEIVGVPTPELIQSLVADALIITYLT